MDEGSKSPEYTDHVNSVEEKNTNWNEKEKNNCILSERKFYSVSQIKETFFIIQ